MDALFANHLFFMALHRGSVRLQGRNVYIQGPIEALTSFVPGSPSASIAAGCNAVRLAPWSGADWPERLQNLGFHQAEALCYMELSDPSEPLHRTNPRVTAHVVGNEAEADVFAGIQSAGFATGNSETDDWWRAYFTEQARANYDHAAQQFFLGYLDEEEPVTSTLVVRGPGVTGIYAVATVPEHRSIGASATVLEYARRGALLSDHERVVLQAVSGSYPERYYEKLGFFTRYVSQVWRR